MSKKQNKSSSSAWQYEADFIKMGDNLNIAKIVRTVDIDEFLSWSRRSENKFFVVAPKGLGKTLLLKAKSKIIRDAMDFSGPTKKEIVFIPESELCEKVAINPGVFTFNQVQNLIDVVNWKRVWLQTIVVSVACACGLELPVAFAKLFKTAPKDTNSADKAKFSRPTDILNTILSDLDKFSHNAEFNQYFNDLYREVRNIDIHVYCFLDSLDQTLRDNLDLDAFALKYSNQDAIKCWANCQIALMHTIHEVCTSNRFIKIYSSIRQEAFWLDPSEVFLQVREYATIIKYRKEDLFRIFENNILITPREKLSNPDHEDPMIRFIGMNEIPHKFVKIAKGSEKELENVFDFIFRHTLGRPRELLMIGDKLMRLPVELRSVNNIRELVNSESHSHIFRHFQSEIIPFFDLKKLSEIAGKIKFNVFSYKESVNIDKSALDYFYKLGLLGLAKKDSNPKISGYYQEFRRVDMFNYHEKVELPKADFYFFHPAVDQNLLNHVKYSTTNIIGYGRAFIRPTEAHFKTKRKVQSLKVEQLTVNGNPSLAEIRRRLTVFVSSPSAQPERDTLIYKLEKTFNDRYEDTLGVGLKTVFWESLPSRSGNAQDLILKNLLKGADILVAFFKFSLGNPVKDVDGKVRSESGTKEEIDEFMKNNDNGIAMVYFYECDEAELLEEARKRGLSLAKMLQHYERLKKYKKKLQAGVFLTKNYRDSNDLLNLITEDILKNISVQDHK
ncbi:MAG: hypothetical protein IPP69_17235 [Flavobacteriales bacterium]|nr:hypothetical protein [Flavobacteriales bacterium]